MIPIDRDALVAAAGGDRRAVEGVLAAIRPSVVAYCWKRLPTRSDAEDVTQEVLLSIAQKLPDLLPLEHDDQFGNLVFTIAHHRMVEAWRRASRTVRLSLLPMPDMPTAITPDRIVEGRETLRELAAVVEQATPFRRSVVWLRAHEFTAEEAGAVLGRSGAAVRVEMHRAMPALKALREVS